MNETSGKMKRERWMDQKAKKIKEQTVKSLEFEVEKLIKKHNSELSNAKANHKREIDDHETNLRQEFSRSFDQYRVQVEREKKQVIEEEKVLQLERFTKQAVQIQTFHKDEVSQLMEEIQRERNKREEERQIWMSEADQIRKIGKDKTETELHSIRDEMDNMKKALSRKHANEILTLKTNEESERKEFERKARANFEVQWKSREEELKTKFCKERDMEIDRVIEKLEFEMKKAREDSERGFDLRISRLKQKHDLEIAEMVKEIEQLKEKLSQLRDESMKTEENNHFLSSINNKLELKLNDLEVLNAKLEEERKDITAIVKKDFEKTLEELSGNNYKLQEEINSMKFSHKNEIHQSVQQQRDIRREFEKEMQELQEKVEEAVKRKDKVVEDVTEQHELAVQKIHQLEKVIHQQGRDIINNTPNKKNKQKCI